MLVFGGLFWHPFLLIAVALVAWFQSFRMIEREPCAARGSGQGRVARTALLYPEPDLRRALLQELESNEGERVYPYEITDTPTNLIQRNESLNRLIEHHDIRSQFGDDTLIAKSVNRYALRR